MGMLSLLCQKELKEEALYLTEVFCQYTNDQLERLCIKFDLPIETETPKGKRHLYKREMIAQIKEAIESNKLMFRLDEFIKFADELAREWQN